MKNLDLSEQLILKLLRLGVEDFCICAGARNSPLVEVLDKNSQLKIFNFFEERSAAFFALGRIALSSKPVVVMTTSGTAAAELLPAVIEAYYTGVPLIVVTADRPKNYRGSGAPQAIEQVGIFSNYVHSCFDIDVVNSEYDLSCWKQNSPIQLNICFAEPLLDRPANLLSNQEVDIEHPLDEFLISKQQNQMESFLKLYKPLVILSGLNAKYHRDVLKLLLELKVPVYIESLSGLRGHVELQEFEIQGGEHSASWFLKTKKCNAIVRIGGVPTLRTWRDLEDQLHEIPVMSISETSFSGLARKENVFEICSLDALRGFNLENKTEKSIDFELDRKAGEFLQSLILKYPLSEQGWYSFFSKKSNGHGVYLGNSLPVRQWDLVADFKAQPSRLFGNRGANGIDGQLSTFFGWAEISKPHWCILGDLTTMYDLSAPWILSQLKNFELNLVIMNNHGGQIFKRMFGDKKLFINPHRIEFSHWAKMWNMNYELLATFEQQVTFNTKTSGTNEMKVYEVHPDSLQTDLFNADWMQFWKSVI